MKPKNFNLVPLIGSCSCSGDLSDIMSCHLSILRQSCENCVETYVRLCVCMLVYLCMFYVCIHKYLLICL